MADKFMEQLAERTRGIETIQARDSAAAVLAAYFMGDQRISYRVVTSTTGSAEQNLNDLGEQGWRLVFVAPFGDNGVTLYLERAERTGEH